MLCISPPKQNLFVLPNLWGWENPRDISIKHHFIFHRNFIRWNIGLLHVLIEFVEDQNFFYSHACKFTHHFTSALLSTNFQKEMLHMILWASLIYVTPMYENISLCVSRGIYFPGWDHAGFWYKHDWPSCIGTGDKSHCCMLHMFVITKRQTTIQINMLMQTVAL